MEERDAIAEASGSLSGESRNSWASLWCRILLRASASKQVTAGRQSADPRVSSDATAGWTKQGLKILAREVTNITVRKAPEFPGRLVMGLHDAAGGAHGEACLRERNRLFAQNDDDCNASRYVVKALSSCADPALKGHGFRPYRYGTRRSWPLGPEGQFPQRLKPHHLVDVNGTAEGVPLQSRKTKTEIAICAKAVLPVARPHHVCTANGATPAATD